MLSVPIKVKCTGATMWLLEMIQHSARGTRFTVAVTWLLRVSVTQPSHRHGKDVSSPCVCSVHIANAIPGLEFVRGSGALQELLMTHRS